LLGETKFQVRKPQFAENLPKEHFQNGGDYAKETALCKGSEIVAQMKATDNVLVIAADTVVVCPSGEIMEKPKNKEHNIVMLNKLQGTTHTVWTGIALFFQGKKHVFCERTDVTFFSLSPFLIHSYVYTGEGLDKAGGYGIQGSANAFVDLTHGEFTNVIGLPLRRLQRELHVFFNALDISNHLDSDDEGDIGVQQIQHDTDSAHICEHHRPRYLNMVKKSVSVIPPCSTAPYSDCSNSDSDDADELSTTTTRMRS